MLNSKTNKMTYNQITIKEGKNKLYYIPFLKMQ